MATDTERSVEMRLGEGIHEGILGMRGGRPGLAVEALPRVSAPTLLIVGGADSQLMEFNRRARERMQPTTELAIVPGATHLFEEPGTLLQAARLAAEWFSRWLVRT